MAFRIIANMWKILASCSIVRSVINATHQDPIFQTAYHLLTVLYAPCMMFVFIVVASLALLEFGVIVTYSYFAFQLSHRQPSGSTL